MTATGQSQQQQQELVSSTLSQTGPSRAGTLQPAFATASSSSPSTGTGIEPKNKLDDMQQGQEPQIHREQHVLDGASLNHERLPAFPLPRALQQQQQADVYLQIQQQRQQHHLQQPHMQDLQQQQQLQQQQLLMQEQIQGVQPQRQVHNSAISNGSSVQHFSQSLAMSFQQLQQQARGQHHQLQHQHQQLKPEVRAEWSNEVKATPVHDFQQARASTANLNQPELQSQTRPQEPQGVLREQQQQQQTGIRWQQQHPQLTLQQIIQQRLLQPFGQCLPAADAGLTTNLAVLQHLQARNTQLPLVMPVASSQLPADVSLNTTLYASYGHHPQEPSANCNSPHYSGDLQKGGRSKAGSEGERLLHEGGSGSRSSRASSGVVSLGARHCALKVEHHAKGSPHSEAAAAVVQASRQPDSSAGTGITKACSRCKVVKSAVFFNQDRGKGDGLYCHCRACCAEMNQRRNQRKTPVTRPTVETKTCTKCKELKQASLFYRQNTSSDGLRSWCKACYSSSASRNKAKPGDS